MEGCGYAVVRGALTSAQVHLLAAECDAVLGACADGEARQLLGERSCALDLLEHVQLPEDHPARSDPNAYLEARCSTIATSDAGKDTLRELLFSRLPQLVCDANGWQNAFLFNEHYVVKPPASDIRFRWHTDRNEQLAMCLDKHTQPEYVAVWCCLEETIGPENGGLIMLPLHACSEQDVPPVVDDSGESSAGESGDVLHHQEALQLQQGDVVLFTSRTWHSSGVNTSSEPRRAYYAQYSESPITIQRSPLCLAIPCEAFIRSGSKRVRTNPPDLEGNEPQSNKTPKLSACVEPRP